MSLADSVLEVAGMMEGDVASLQKESQGRLVPSSTVAAYAKMLRVAVKAAEGSGGPSLPVLTPAMQHLVEIEKAKAEFRKGRADGALKGGEKADAEEKNLGRLVGCIGGKSDADFVDVDSGMPCGAKMMVAGEVYILGEDGWLHFSQSDTEEVNRIKGGST